MLRTKLDPEVVKDRLAKEFLALDIRALIEQYGDILLPSGDSKRQLNGPCPWRARGECTAKENGFMVWTTLTDRNRHYYCRQCRKSGTILDLVQQLHKKNFRQACELLGIGNVYADDGKWSAPAPLDRNTNITAINPRVQAWLENLHLLYPRMQTALSMKRARAYLEQRAVSFDLAHSQALGYLPAFTSNNVTPELANLRPWCDRIIFPVHTLAGVLCYAGRTLHLWEPGMNEDEHKDLLDAYNARMEAEGGYVVRRWLYTLESFFNWPVVARAEKLIFVEGPFDVLACMAGGLDTAIAIGTSGVDARAIPLRIDQAVMGLDIDGPGSLAAKKLAKDMRRKGIEVEIAAPILGKDWSEAYRLHGLAGLAPLLPVTPAPEITAERGQVLAIVAPEITEITDDTAGGQVLEVVAPAPDVQQLTGLCFTCLNEDRETVVLDAQENTYDELLYCPAHNPKRARQLTPEGITEAFSEAFSDWTIEYLPGDPVYTLEQKQISQVSDDSPFWRNVARQIAEPPHYFELVKDQDGNPMRSKGGSLVFKLGKPMMRPETWARRRAKQLAWRPDPALLAHRSSNGA